MEITQATESTETGTEGGEGGANPPAQTEDVSRLLQQFEEFNSGVTARLDRFEERLTPEQEEAEEEDDLDFAIDPNDFADDDFTDDGSLTPEAQQRAFVDMMRKVVQAELAPERAKQTDERRAREATALEEKYPELRDEKVQDAMIGKTIEFARSVGKPELAQEPALLEMVYLAETARQRAGGEIPAGSEREVVLERGSSAPPAEAQQGDEGDRIVSAFKKQHHRVGR